MLVFMLSSHGSAYQQSARWAPLRNAGPQGAWPLALGPSSGKRVVATKLDASAHLQAVGALKGSW